MAAQGRQDSTSAGGSKAGSGAGSAAGSASGESAREQVDRLMDQGREAASNAIEQGSEQVRKAADASRAATAAGAMSAIQTGAATADGMDDIAQAWSGYARDVMQRTTQASQSMLRCHNFSDMLGIQAELMRGHLEAFLSHSSRVAELTSRMAVRGFDTLAKSATTAAKTTSGGSDKS